MTRTVSPSGFLLAGLLLAGFLTSCGGTPPRASDGEAEPALSPTERAKTAIAAPVDAGVALYTLRDEMGADPRGTLAAVAALGYAYVEAAGYDPEARTFYGMTPAAFAAYLDRLGLAPMSTHMGAVTRDNVDALVADSRAAGFAYFVIPVPPMGAFGVDEETRAMLMEKPMAEVMADVNCIAERGRAGDIAVLYHNHDFEFRPAADGVVPTEYFL